jgi:amino acid adenylation domain-containing protein
MQTGAKTVAGLSDARRALLNGYLRGGKARGNPIAAVIPKRPGSGPAPLSYGQQQIWIHSQFAGKTLIYNEPVTIHRYGELDVPAFERSFTEIIRRHEAWRTTFDWIDDQPSQVIQPPPSRTIEIPFTDLRHLPEAQREPEAIRLATEDVLQPFDLARGPLYRPRLIRLGDAEHRLFLTLYHIIFDGVSLYRVFLPELQALYEAFSRNEAPDLPELPVQYPDYAVWHRKRTDRILKKDLPYWKTALEDLPVLDLKTDHPRPPIETFAGDMELMLIPPRLTNALKAVSQEHGVTLFMTLTAAFKALLHGYTGQEDIVLGSVSDLRTHTELQGLMGFFLNTIVIRTRLSGDLPFTDLLARVKTSMLGALSHSEIPFELLVNEVIEERDPSRAPLFQVSISVEPPLTPLKEGWAFTQMDVDPGTAKLDLHLELDERQDGLFGRFIYNTALFERETIRTMKSRWLKLLDQIVAAPGRRVRDLLETIWREENLDPSAPSASVALNGSARQEILPEWNATEQEFPADALLHRLFEAQVERTPDAIAVVFENEHLTYAALNRRANQLAHKLGNLGLAPDGLAGVCMERSLEMVVALLAILKAGGAYVPLDPTYPQERLALMIDDARMPVILAQARFAQLCDAPSSEAGSPRLVCVDTEDCTAENPANPTDPADFSPENLAYVIYTSGSTGRPKGVMIPHRAVCNYIFWMQAVYPVDGRDRVLQQISISFDPSVWEFFLPLFAGAQLVMAQPEGHRDTRYIVETIARYGITTLQTVPSMLRMLVEEPRLAACGSSLRRLFCIGEALPPDLCEKFFARLGDCRLINIYGPTECTIAATFHACVPGARIVPIGRPVANTRLYILDAKLQPVPVGVPGELYLAGVQLARGYWGRPELTAAAFLHYNGERVYKTGDLARWLPDGTVDCLGRVDNQVKIRGFRIEPGEIEAALNRQPGVADSAVVLREDKPGDKSLVAYVVSDQGVNGADPSHVTNLNGSSNGRISESALISELKKTMPVYMVPSAIVILPALPRTPNGKLDRRALPAPDYSASRKAGASFITPSTWMEAMLVEVWQKILDRRPIGVTDDFFDLGGNSLLAIRMLAETEKRTGIKISPRLIFGNPDIRRLAIASRHPEAAAHSPIVAVQTGGNGTPMFFFHGDFDEGGLYCVKMARHLGPDRPFHAIDPHGVHDELPHTIEEMAAARLELIRQIRPKGPYILGGYCNGGLVAFEIARRLEAAGETVSSLLLLSVDGSNTGFAWLHHLIGLLPGGRERRFNSFLKWRERILFFRAVWKRHLEALAAPVPLSEQPARFARKALRILRKAFALARPQPVPPAPAAPDLDPNGPGATRKRISFIHHRAREAYLPRPYRGPAHLLWPSEIPLSDPAAGWHPVMPQIQLLQVPGGHFTSLQGENLLIVSEKLRLCLDEDVATGR